MRGRCIPTECVPFAVEHIGRHGDGIDAAEHGAWDTVGIAMVLIGIADAGKIEQIDAFGTAEP
jgi:hypothetical protein